MRKVTAIFLILVIVSGLFGCKENTAGDTPVSYNATDLLVVQAVRMAQKVGMRTEEAYMKAISAVDSAIPLAQTFAQAATESPIEARLAVTDQTDLSVQLLQLCSQAGGYEQFSCVTSLIYSTQIFLPEPPEQTTALYLRYSDTCHFVTVFSPLENNIVSVWTCPVFTDAVDTVLEGHFADAESLDEAGIAQAAKAAGNVEIAAECTGEPLDDDYYSQLATHVLGKIKPVAHITIAEYTKLQSISSRVSSLTILLSYGVRHTQTYAFPESIDAQIDQALQASSYSDQLRDLTRHQMTLSWLNTVSSSYGEDWIAINAVLQSVLDTPKLGATATAEEAPRFISIDLAGQATVLLAIYPSEYNTYLYYYVCIPISAQEAEQVLLDLGATIVQ